MSNNHGSKICSEMYEIDQEPDFPVGNSSNSITSVGVCDEWKKSRFNGRSYFIGRAYDEPRAGCNIENILLGRKYIID